MMKKTYWHFKAIFLTVIDIAILFFAHFLGLLLRFDLNTFAVPPQFVSNFYSLSMVLGVTGLFFLWYSGLVNSVWCMSVQREVRKIIWIVAVIEIIQILMSYSTFEWEMPPMYYVMGYCLTVFFWVLVRLTCRHIRYLHWVSCMRAFHDRCMKELVDEEGVVP